MYQNDLNKPSDQQSNVMPPKMPPDIAKSIDESNYVKLSSITTAIAGAADLANANNRSMRRSEPPNGKVHSDDVHENDKINELDNKAIMLNNFYANTNGYNNSKTIMSMVNQKNLNNLNIIFNNNNNNSATNTNNMLNNSDFAKLSLTNGSSVNGGTPIDHNQNGLPAIPKAPPLPGSMAQVPCDNTNKLNAACNGNSQAYVIKSNGTNDVVNGDDIVTASVTNDTAKGRW